MKLGVLFSGGKDSCYAAYLAKKHGYELACLISVFSKNPDSYMFHTPSISSTEKQAKLMEIPLIAQKTQGKKEKELRDLEKVIKKAKHEHDIKGIVTGAIQSVYQASRIQKICDKLGLECFNPLWQKPEIEYLDELIDNGFKTIITGVFAYPLNESWLGREINHNFIKDIKKLYQSYKINPAGEGGEFETLMIDCPLFKRPLDIKSYRDIDEGKNSWRREID